MDLLTGSDANTKVEDAPPGKILIVEDSPFFMHVLRRRIGQELGVPIIEVETLAQAALVIEEEGPNLFLCLIDLVLPDAPNGEIVDYVTGKGLAAVVFTGAFSEEMREHVLSSAIIDYVTKDSLASLDYLVAIVRRLCRNAHQKAIVVDDSRTARAYIGDLLRLYRFNVIEAVDGEEALALLAENPDIRLMVTDYYMPRIDGFELIKRVRQTHSRNALAIIGVSTGGSAPLSARFIKYGANDFINKPFLREEFFCRIAQNMDTLDYIAALARSAQVDPLTGLPNRRYLFDVASRALAATLRVGGHPVVAMIDADHFKEINDRFGHDVGDQVLEALARVMDDHVQRKSDVLARFGGEEFCVFVSDMSPEQAFTFFDGLRAAVAQSPLSVPGLDDLSLTISIGVSTCAAPDLRTMIHSADRLLYDAKAAGRDCTVVEGLGEWTGSSGQSGGKDEDA
ncbi:diguanylate cyclase [Rhodospirillum rubrum]|uniref:diguanylate cyclase n=1 Tax=Rhodospirillum rubrum TaxID=1085 RepID=UPI001903354D|nr:diguanylate cyclase [Rhodospirillum rubrum]MBK1665192.1 diguanylate cyclase [Rhodospirillum rubrum]MBK1677064.1 diguanylate cyclase [Rhodospirillum rubrum]